jgi:hypothetical protein
MSEFYSVIQLLATLAMGFVILGYSEFFIGILKTKFFHADEAISKAEKECLSSIPDKSTRDNLKPTKVGKRNTSKEIEELRINCENIECKIKDFVNQSRKDLEEMSKLRSLVSMSLFVFMFTVTLLFLPSLKQQYGRIVNLFLLPYSSLCIIYMVFGWIFGEKADNCKLLKFESHRHPIIYFFSTCLVSVAFVFIAYWQALDFGNLWKYLFVALVLVGWLNFVMYALFIRQAISRLKYAVEQRKKPIVDECNNKNLKQQCDLLINVAKMAES